MNNESNEKLIYKVIRKYSVRESPFIPLQVRKRGQNRGMKFGFRN